MAINMCNYLKIISLFALILLTFSCSKQDTDNSSISENTQVSGEISSDTVWSLDKSPYIVVDDVVVERGATLTIEPQVEIRFERDKGLTVKGALLADGSAGFTPSDESELIKFTSNQSMPDMNDWQGIKFDNTNDDKSLLRFVKIQYATIGISSFSSMPQIVDCIIRNNHEGIHWDAPPTHISHNIVSNNINGIVVQGDFITLSKNIIQSNEVGIIAIFFPFKLKENNIFDNEAYALISKTQNTVYATNNWWGTTDISYISSQIDMSRPGSVLFQPILTSKVEDAGPRY